ncbi:MAG: response regulator [Deltaproteobacteria bacterium]|nr:response regulator [Deltaproteobacteria bacterium]
MTQNDMGVNILVVEDSPEDFEAMKRAFHKAGLVNQINRVEDGDDALDYLYSRGEFIDPERAPRPGLVLLDLNLPGTDGREVLAEMKSDSSLKKIPVIVLTTSNDPRDVDTCYSLGANSYIQKPVSMEGFIRAIALLKEYWFSINLLPKEK